MEKKFSVKALSYGLPRLDIDGGLDDKTAQNCEHCTNRLGKEFLPSAVSAEFIHIAEEFVNKLIIPIEPRKKWVNSAVTTASKIPHINQQGFCISKYGDAGYGEMVKQGKYSKKMRFCDELVGKSVEILRSFIRKHKITHICYVPSHRSELVKDFAARVAESLKLEFADILKKYLQSSKRKWKTVPTSVQMHVNHFS